MKSTSPLFPSEKIKLWLPALATSIAFFAPSVLAQSGQAKLEEILVVAEKRTESLQDLSQAVTALSSNDLDIKNIQSFVDLSAIAPGVNVAKNEGFKTIVSIRGVGNEANQNAIANPSVSYHLDGIYIASPFALQTDFIDVDRIEALRGPQGTLFGQNSTGGALNVLSKLPDFDGVSGKADVTVGDHGLYKVRGSINTPVSDSLAGRTSISKFEHDGFTDNILNGQDLDDANNLSARTDWLWKIDDTSSLRFFSQYFKEDSNGAAIKGINDPTPDARELAQDTFASYELESQIYGVIAEKSFDLATVKYLGSYQKDDITIVRDNDRHSFALNPEITISEFDPETNVQTTTTHEINVISNEPLFNVVDWIVGAFYLDTEIDITIREELDLFDENGNFGGNGVLDGLDAGDQGFISDAFPTRESLSFYGQGTIHLNDAARVIAGLRYTEDEVESEVFNFFATTPTLIEASVEEVTGRLAFEYDISNDTLFFTSYTRGFKPGGSNLTFGIVPGDIDPISGGVDNSAPLVLPTFDNETIDAYELGVKTEWLDGRLRTNVAAFFYDYQNLQFQATDPNIFQGGVSNIPETEIKGIELEATALLGESWVADLKLAYLDSEITEDFIALDNVLVAALGFAPGDDVLRADLAQNVVGNELAKSPDLTLDASLKYHTEFGSGHQFTGVAQYTYRGEFQQRIFNNPAVDQVDDYDIVNLTLSVDFAGDTWGTDLIVTNVFDEDGVNSRMTDVFGVNATGEELVAPRQIMARVRYQF